MSHASRPASGSALFSSDSASDSASDTASDSASDRASDGSEEEGLDVALATEHCRVLLASVRVARVAFVDDGLPQLVIMNHLADGDDVLVQTSEDTRLAVLTRDGTAVPAVLEVDSVFASGRTGWSVVASGTLARDTGSAIARMPIPWRTQAVGVLLRLTVTSLTGRHVGPR
jgi:hypothetical protein